MSNETITIEDALFQLQDMGMTVNELKRDGCEVVSIDAYEKLLDWAIESLRKINDNYNAAI